MGIHCLQETPAATAEGGSAKSRQRELGQAGSQPAVWLGQDCSPSRSEVKPPGQPAASGPRRRQRYRPLVVVGCRSSVPILLVGPDRVVSAGAVAALSADRRRAGGRGVPVPAAGVGKPLPRIASRSPPPWCPGQEHRLGGQAEAGHSAAAALAPDQPVAVGAGPLPVVAAVQPADQVPVHIGEGEGQGAQDPHHGRLLCGCVKGKKTASWTLARSARGPPRGRKEMGALGPEGRPNPCIVSQPLPDAYCCGRVSDHPPPPLVPSSTLRVRPPRRAPADDGRAANAVALLNPSPASAAAYPSASRASRSHLADREAAARG
jgi:hypothetical protein